MSFEEKNLEQELQSALRRKEPAKGFAERVAGKVERTKRQPVWAMVAIAASLAVGVTGIVRYEQYREAEHAKDQLMLALRITARTLGTVERKLNE